MSVHCCCCWSCWAAGSCWLYCMTCIAKCTGICCTSGCNWLAGGKPTGTVAAVGGCASMVAAASRHALPGTLHPACHLWLCYWCTWRCQQGLVGQQYQHHRLRGILRKKRQTEKITPSVFNSDNAVSWYSRAKNLLESYWFTWHLFSIWSCKLIWMLAMSNNCSEFGDQKEIVQLFQSSYRFHRITITVINMYSSFTSIFKFFILNY